MDTDMWNEFDIQHTPFLVLLSISPYMVITNSLLWIVTWLPFSDVDTPTHTGWYKGNYTSLQHNWLFTNYKWSCEQWNTLDW